MQGEQPNTNGHMEKAKTKQTRKSTTKRKHKDGRIQKTNNRTNQTKNDHLGKHKQKIKRQIDYVVINRRFRNCVRTAQTITGRKANMQQTQQHNVIIMRICVKLAKKLQ